MNERSKRPSPSAKRLWSCPRCNRKFAKPNQAHSCRVRDLDDHFRDKDPRLRSLFDALKRALKRSGTFRVDSVSTSINLISKHHFGAVAVRRDYLRLGFILDHEVRDARIIYAARIGPHRVAHHVKVRTCEDLDTQLLGWLAEAQAMQSHVAS